MAMEMFFGGNPEDLPPGLREMVEGQREAQERHQMAHDDAEHRVQSFLSELSQEQLETLHIIISGLFENAALTGYHIGSIKAELKHRFNICPYHGVNHDAELAKGLGGTE